MGIAWPPIRTAWAKLGANYLNRFADQHLWDQLFETPLGKWIKAQPQWKKYGGELLSYLGVALAEYNLGNHTPLRIFLGGVITDSAQEISKRALNGGWSGGTHRVLAFPIPEEVIRGVAALFNLPHADMSVLAQEWQNMSEEEKERHRTAIRTMSSTQLSQFAGADQATRTMLVDLLTPPRKHRGRRLLASTAHFFWPFG